MWYFISDKWRMIMSDIVFICEEKDVLVVKL